MTTTFTTLKTQIGSGLLSLEGQNAEPVSRDRLQEALQEANMPTLVAVLAHTTGDPKWLSPPFSPSRTKGLSDHTSGGLDKNTQDYIRSAALKLVLEMREADSPLKRDLSDHRLSEIMSVCMGEDVPVDYAGMMAEEMGLRRRFDPEPIKMLEKRHDYSVAIIGAGLSGICLAVQLKQAGIDFTIIEKNSDLGGTWYENQYPGSGVDTPSYWYSYSFNQVNWNRYYSKQGDVHSYLVSTARKFGLEENIQFGSRVEAARFDENTQTWEVRAQDNEGRETKFSVNFLVSAVGQLNKPKVPRVPGQDTFEGAQFHSAEWPSDIDVKGKKVAVIGTGASAMQLVPAIADQVEELTVFQRSPQWIAPNEDYQRLVSNSMRYLMQHVPYYSAWYRARQVWAFGDKIFDNLIIDPEWEDQGKSINSINHGYRKYFIRYMREQLEEYPDLLEKAVPSYPPFGKRMLLDSGWFSALKLPQVNLETEGIESIYSGGVRTKEGTEYEADVIVYATGFESLNLLSSVDIVGRDGISLREQWGEDDPRAYLGMSERGMPNMFFLYGPNTNLGHGGSLIFVTECHVRYIMSLLQQVIERGAHVVECRQEVRDDYNELMDDAHSEIIWTHQGMDTWYRNKRGRVVTNSPWKLVDLWHQTRYADLTDYEVQ